MKITKGNEIKEVGEKAGKIAIHLFGWSEFAEPKRPNEIGTKTRRIEPPVIADGAVKLKDPKAEYPGDIIPKPEKDKGAFEKLPPVDVTEKVSEPVKKTRKPAVKSKSKK